MFFGNSSGSSKPTIDSVQSAVDESSDAESASSDLLAKVPAALGLEVVSDVGTLDGTSNSVISQTATANIDKPDLTLQVVTTAGVLAKRADGELVLLRSKGRRSQVVQVVDTSERGVQFEVETFRSIRELGDSLLWGLTIWDLAYRKWNLFGNRGVGCVVEHLPTGLIGTCWEFEHFAENRSRAERRLAARLARLFHSLPVFGHGEKEEEVERWRSSELEHGLRNGLGSSWRQNDELEGNELEDGLAECSGPIDEHR